MPYFDKHFTVIEANNLLPRLREIFIEIHSLIEESYPKPGVSLVKKSGLSTGRTNGKQRIQSQQKNEVLKAINHLINEITDQGIVIQDITRGLIDFPCFLEGEEVFLCYELADGDRIKFYHGLNAGYAGRCALPDKYL